MGSPGADLKSALTLAREAGHRDVERVLIKAGAAPDQKRPAEEALDDQLLLPSGFMPGKAEGAASDQIQVDEVEAYRLRFQGSSYMTATAATPVRMCEMHDSFYYEVLVEAAFATSVLEGVNAVVGLQMHHLSRGPSPFVGA